MIENELYVAKEHKFDNPLITITDSIIDSYIGDFHKKLFHNFKYEFIYDNKLTYITNDEKIKLIISGKSMNLYEINKKLTLGRQRGFVFN